MSQEAILWIASLVGGLMLVGGVVYLWINRTPSIRRDDTGRLPLFGGGYDLDVDGNPIDAPPPAARPPVRQPFHRPSDAAWDNQPSVPTSAAVPPRPVPSRPVPPRPTSPPAADPWASPSGGGSSAAFHASMQNGGLDGGIYGAPEAHLDRATRPSPRPTPPGAPPTQPGPTPPRSTPVIRTFTTSGATRATPASTMPVTPTSPVPAFIPGELASTPVSSQGVPGTMVEGHLLRFSVPQEGTLQFLPGRLEIAAGRDAGREIRFVRVPGPNDAEVTFGRSEGELYRHIQLRDQTVSRTHARMRLLNGTWYLLNLSLTNPVVHNGNPLTGGEERPVSDGDRIEMGEVLFTFRSR